MREDPRSPGDARPGDDAVPSVSEALSRAGRHARKAVSEGILAVRALLDAISLLQGGANRQRRTRRALGAIEIEVPSSRSTKPSMSKRKGPKQATPVRSSEAVASIVGRPSGVMGHSTWIEV